MTATADGATFMRKAVLQWTEDQLMDAIIDMARLHGFTRIYHGRPGRTLNGWRTAVVGDAGFPDLVLAHPEGRIVFAELKTMKGKPTPEQASWLAALEEAQSDGTVRVCLWRPCCWLSGEIESVLR